MGRFYKAATLEKMDLLDYYDYSSKYSNSVAQKILVIRESVDDTDHQSFLELGFAYDPEISFKKIYSYNLQTYNKKRGWNNSDGWANPENFEKFRC